MRSMSLVNILAFCIFFIFFLPSSNSSSSSSDHSSISQNRKREIIDVKNEPDDVVWVVQLSDLHISVHHPQRGLDLKKHVGPALSIINPSLVFITGDLTDGKSKDLLVMKQIEEEWVEYRDVMEDVIRRSGLKKNTFYDLRGNHDNFGVPIIGGSFDFFSKYSINGQLGRNGPVNSVTVQTNERKLLFVGVDSAMTVGLRGPTNLFGHPTDQLLTQLDSELAQWDSQSEKPVTKISFGHFPLSFSAASFSGKTLKDIFLKHSVSAYICGHLHTKFGKNLKRHHLYKKFLQLNAHRILLQSSSKNCSNPTPSIQEFWEWETGDWRKSRAMRIFAIDRGYLSFVDVDFQSGAKETIILPTFPLDSRYMLTTSSPNSYHCKPVDLSSYGSIRVLVFSVSPIVLVVARVYDSRSETLLVVVETTMRKHGNTSSRGDQYTAVWNYHAFEDPSPDRFWLQIQVTDISGKSSFSELRPFSVNGRSAKLPWTWTEFFVMGCDWHALYLPILWSFLLFIFSILLIPRIIIIFSNHQYSYKKLMAKKGLINAMGWVSTELYRVPSVWFGLLSYLFYLILCPWFYGEVFTDGTERGYMTYKGWVIDFNGSGKLDFIGFPDIMVVVLPHLLFVVFPTILLTGALAAQRAASREKFHVLSGKKEDDYVTESNNIHDRHDNYGSMFCFSRQWIRNLLLVFSLAVFWKHLKNCRALMKAYTMNPILHFPIYSLSIPLILAYTIYKTRKVCGSN